MSEIPFDKAGYLSSQGGARLKLAQQLGRSGQRRGDDALLATATKRSSDRVKFTHFFLKQKLVDGLDDTIAEHLREHPALKDKVYIAILTDKSFKTEVISLDDAVAAVEDMPKEEAEQILRQNPVGYFRSADFTIKTGEDPSYAGLKTKLDSFFEKNADVFQYLRENPDANIALEDLY